MSTEQGQKIWEEVFFSGALALLGALFITGARLTPVDASVAVNARTLPYIMAGAIVLYGALNTVLLLRAARLHARPSFAKDGIVLTIIVPLSLLMVLYVPAIEALGYLLATAVILAMVFWVFGARDLLFDSILTIVGAGVSYFCFVVLLGMFFPDGWLIEALQKMLGYD